MKINPIAKLKSAQFQATAELKTKIKTAQVALASKIAAAGANPMAAKSQKFRDHFFGKVKTHYEALGSELDAWGKELTEKTAVDWHKVALDDVKTFGGKINTPVLKFNRKRVERYWGIIHPDNTQNLAAVYTQKMTAQEIQNLRTAFLETSRQRTLEGWSQNTFHKNLQAKWDELAGNLASNRFVDSRGRPWSNANYLSMLARTTTARVARDSYFDTLIENGDDLVRIGPSGDSCPICQAWVGIIISISGKDIRFPSYQDALNAGMFHPNCDCLQMRMDEDVHKADIERQGKTGNPPDWKDRKAVEDYKASFMADPAKPATSTLANIQAKVGQAKQAAGVSQILDAVKAVLVDPVADAAIAAAKKSKGWKWKATKQANLRAKLQALEEQAAENLKALEGAQGRMASIRTGMSDPAFKQAQKEALAAQKAAALLQLEKEKLIALAKKQADELALAQIEKAAADAKAKALAAEQATAKQAAAAGKEAADAERTRQILDVEETDLDALGQAGAKDFGGILKRIDQNDPAAVTGGTQKSFMTRDPTGQRWVTKFYDGNEDRVRTEWTANRLYKTAGIRVPQGRLATFEGKLAYCSKVDESVGKCLSVNADWAAAQLQTRRGFAADCWIGNWDVAGEDWDNLLLVPNKASSILRVDHGGSFFFRAQGELKPKGVFGPVVQETETLRNPSINRQTTRLFAQVTDDDIRSGVDQLRKLATQKRIHDTIAAAGWDVQKAAELEKVMIARKNDLTTRYLGIGKKQKVAQETASGVTSAAPVEGPITQGELNVIKESRQNGTAIRLDGDQIEDQAVLFWHETDAMNRPVTSAVFKVRGEGSKALAKILKIDKAAQTESIAAAPWVDDGLNKDFLDAIMGISKNAPTGIRQKDLDRWNALKQKFFLKRDQLDMAVANGDVAVESFEAYNKHFKPWFEAMGKAVGTAAPGDVVVFAKPGTGVFGSWGGPVLTPKPIAPPAIPVPGSKMEFALSNKYPKKDIQAGFGKELGAHIQGFEYTYAETKLSDGTVVRVWPNAASVNNKPIPFALRGQVQIIAQGQDANAAETVRQSIAKLGIRSTRPSAIEEEFLYLHQTAWATVKDVDKWGEYGKALAAVGSDTAKKAEFVKGWLKKELGTDVTKSPLYKPAGQAQIYGHGRVQRYRPDMVGPEWDAFEKDYRLWHEIHGGTLDEKLDLILNSGGQLISNSDKLRRGISPAGGWSPGPDFESGGADYAFLRVLQKKVANGMEGIVWKAGPARRLDAIAMSGDPYGRCDTPEFIIGRRIKTVKGLASIGGSSANEINFKRSISVLEEVDRIVCSSEQMRVKVKAVLAKHTWKNKWVDGREIDDVVKLAGAP